MLIYIQVKVAMGNNPVAIISDIHGNLEALKAVIDDIEARQIARVWCLGDIVGYGPQPDECIEQLRRLPLISVAGNHDLGIIGRLDLTYFNAPGQAAIAWQKPRISFKNINYLKGLAAKERPEPDVIMVHASLRDPAWEYIYSARIAAANFKYLETNICFFAHTHLPIIYWQPDGRELKTIIPPVNQEYKLANDNSRWLINPGSVGQPRDNNPKAAYLIFDRKEMTLESRRLDYPINQTRELISKAGLPSFLSERLVVGK